MKITSAIKLQVVQTKGLVPNWMLAHCICIGGIVGMEF